MTTEQQPSSQDNTNPSGSLAERLGSVVVGAREDLVVNRQVVRGDPRYVVHDPVAFRNHSLTPLEYRILCSFGFRQTLGEIFSDLVAGRVLAASDDDEFFEFVLSLHGLGLLIVPGMPTETVWQRHQERRKATRRGVMRYLISLRIPLGNPDQWLERVLPYVSWLFGRVGITLWSLLLIAAVWNCGGRLGELYGEATNLLSLGTLPIVWCSLVTLKALHELGHAFAIKRFGGAVPDFGIIFIFMTPCAYVDANSSWTFSSRWHRLFVALGGMYVETLIAFVFAIVWAGTQPGFVHDVAQSVVVLASITTVLININPLIKFDGYYAFSDLIGIVNLQERAMRYLRGAAEHLFLGLPRSQDTYTRTEKVLIWVYAPSAFLYRISLALGVTAVMMTTWPAIGAALGLAFGWMLIGDPLRRLTMFLWNGDRTEAVRLRARCVTVTGLIAVALVAALLPVSYSIVAPGVLDPGVKRSVRAPAHAFVQSIDVANGDVVEAGVVVCHLLDPELEEQLLEVEADLAVARTQFDVHELIDPAAAVTYSAKLTYLERRAIELSTRATELAMTAPEGGTVVEPGNVVPGQYIQQGDELMQLHSQHRFVRVVLTDHEVTRARLEIGSKVTVRWSSDPTERVVATVREIRGSASRWQVPVELTIAAGGEIYARGTGNDVQADQPYLHIFLEAESVPLAGARTGLTATVQFEAGMETLGSWAKRRLLTFLYNWRMS